MRKILSILFLFSFYLSFGQNVSPRSNPSVTVQDSRWKAQYNMILPAYLDTTAANLQIGIDSCGAMIYTYTDNTIWKRSCSPKRWEQLGGADANNGTVIQGGKVVLGGTPLNIISGTYIRNNYSPGAPATLIQWSNRLSQDSIVDSGSGTTLNRAIGATDPTYADVMFSLQRNFKEEYGDTANLQYGGVISIFDRRQYDSTGSSFGTLASGKPIVWNDKGVEVTNQMFPPKDTADVYTDQDGRSSASFSSLWGLGAAWGYNLHVISALYPDYSLASYNSVLDFQRVAARTRHRSLTGFGVAGYLTSYKTWEAQMDTTTASLGNYLSKVIGFYAYGNTDINITGLGATKAQILVRSKTDTSIGFLAAPQYRNTNDVNTGIGFAAVGDSDYNYVAGKLRISGIFPTRANGGDGDKNLEVVGTSRFTDVMYFKDAGFLSSANPVSIFSPGNVQIRALDSTTSVSIGGVFGNGAAIKLTGKNTNDATRGGVDVNIAYGGNAGLGLNPNAPFRIVFYDNNQVLERRYRFERTKASIEVVDSISFQAPAYKFGGIPAGAGTRALRYNLATGYITYADTTTGGGGTNIYNSDGTLSGNRELSLSTFTLHMANGSLFGSTELYLDPTANNEQAYLAAYNTTGADNKASYYANTTDLIAQTVMQAAFNSSAKTSIIELDANTSNGTITATATDAISIIGGTMEIRATTAFMVLRTTARAIDLTDSIYIYTLPFSNDTTTYKIMGVSNGGGVVRMNWSNSSGAGGGTVTSVAAGLGMNFSTITTTGSVILDTTYAVTKATTQVLSATKVFTATTTFWRPGADGSTTLQVMNNAGNPMVQIGTHPSSTTFGAISLGNQTPAAGSVNLFGNATQTVLNAATDLYLRQNNTSYLSLIGGVIGINIGASTANSTLQVSGSIAYGYVAKSANYTATINDQTIECTANTFQVTLPTAVGITGRVYTIVNSGAGTITIATTSSQTFVNVVATPTTLSMATVGTRQVESNGANWMLISSL